MYIDLLLFCIETPKTLYDKYFLFFLHSIYQMYTHFRDTDTHTPKHVALSSDATHSVHYLDCTREPMHNCGAHFSGALFTATGPHSPHLDWPSILNGRPVGSLIWQPLPPSLSPIESNYSHLQCTNLSVKSHLHDDLNFSICILTIFVFIIPPNHDVLSLFLLILKCSICPFTWIII